MNKLSIILLSISFAVTGTYCQSNKSPQLHTPAELMKIMEDSKLVYELKLEYESKNIIDTPTVLSNHMYLRESRNGYTLETFTLSDQALSLFNEAEDAFHKKDYTQAITRYHRVLQMQPEYFPAFTMIGDAYYSSEAYDSALVYFKKAIQNNFADYNAHWFLADTYNKCYLIDSALKEITVAHLLNVNHQYLNEAMRRYRQKSNRPWQEWDYVPRYNLSIDGNRVTIHTTADWLGYAMVKAVWKYEPGYSEAMIGKSDTKMLVNWPEEKEAIIASLSDSLKNGRITKIITDGYINEFIIYELIAKKAPAAIVLLPREIFYRVAEYINKFH